MDETNTILLQTKNYRGTTLDSQKKKGLYSGKESERLRYINLTTLKMVYPSEFMIFKATPSNKNWVSYPTGKKSFICI